ncbi:calcium-binding protein [Azohydromonas aeria]|uniref:calcium-binding protein n=1 Tax=Azohydromonas aeria TaxID=2590212 RepID=UPI0018DFC347|nr:calcium-binding protein [Azohydromonas aeria]
MPLINGTRNGETLNGTTGDDTLFGGLGNDTLKGGLGNDRYRFELGTGNDRIEDAGGTADVLELSDPEGLFSSMSFYRDGANLVLDFGSAAGRLTLVNQFAAGGASRIETLTTDDGWGPFTIQNGLAGSAGNDLIVGTDAAESINGGAGDDLLFGGGGNDTLLGGAGDNELYGGAGNDRLVSGADGDDLYGGAGSDTLAGSAGGWDEAYYLDQTAGVVANFSGLTLSHAGRSVGADKVLETGSGAIDTLISIEGFTGSAYNDYVVLGRSDASLSLTLGKGNDTLVGGAGGNNVWASVGYWDDPSGVIVNFSGKALTATVGGKSYTVAAGSARDGWGGTDTFKLDGSNLSINGSDAADYIRGRDDGDNDQIWEYFSGGSGNDTIDGGTGQDQAGYHHTGDDAGDHGVVVNLSAAAWSGSFAGAVRTVAAGTAYDDSGSIDRLISIENIDGSIYADVILGSAGINHLNGNEGNDIIHAGAGNDQLTGGAGDDTLAGGAGFDMLTGGAGKDCFVFDAAFNTGNNSDGITDFTRLTDSIRLDDAVFSGLTAGKALGSAFYAAAGATSARAATDRIIYDTNTGALYFDADGSGTGKAAVQFAWLTNKAVLTSQDFWVV